jgi:uncharacterized membrane-anchored protein YhcB (DUF1043 family)
MDSIIIEVIIGGVALVAGIIVGKLVFAKNKHKKLLQTHSSMQKQQKKRNYWKLKKRMFN